ncbi:hypothetical protein H0H87_011873 [Tephrocybe sp. NHM501043]|nr:hypothetical protein H0H87_011873 [Tephrocybe sp. NHM501043]
MSTNPITPITVLPTFASAEEHATIVGSTPASFADIPPVLKHNQPNVRVILDPPVPGFEDASTLEGTLYVLTSVLVFFSSTASRGFTIAYPSITLHAISRAGPEPSIYCQLDAGVVEGADPEDEDAETELQELMVIPKDASALDTIFESLSLCAALHPDPSSPNDDDENDDAIIDSMNSPFDMFTGSVDEELSEVGRVRNSSLPDDAALVHIQSIIYDPFEHVEEEEVEGPPQSDDEEDEKGGAFEDADEDGKESKPEAKFETAKKHAQEKKSEKTTVELASKTTSP